MNEIYHAFISYGRADSKEFAQKLCDRLTNAGFNIWFDQNDIPLGVNFQNQIDDGIAKSDNFIFIISPHAVNSPYCRKEINRAVECHKRIIPLLHIEQITHATWQARNPNGTAADWQEYQTKGLDSSLTNMPPEIGKINWVFFRENIDDLETAYTGLIELVHSHSDYVRQHTEFLVKALKWSAKQKQNRYLLIGEERQKAEAWLDVRFDQEQPPCTPSDLHCEYICESLKNANNLMTQVFLSYSDQNREIMEKISRRLQREKITLWTNKTDIKSGQNFQQEINRGIAAADNLVYLVSSAALKSQDCQQKIELALAYKKRIICLIVEATDLAEIPDFLRALQFIDLTDWTNPEYYQSQINQLIKQLKEEESYYYQHKVLLVKALQWQSQNRNPSILLRGYNLEHFQTWLKIAQSRQEHLPIALQIQFLEASINQPATTFLEVFISYSRTDSDFARKLNDALLTQGKSTWFDQESIAYGTDFKQEIYRGIENSDNFLFVISPSSVNSPYCAAEVAYARELNKRLVTVLYRQVETQQLHPELAKVQWIDFAQEPDQFYSHFSELIRTLDTDRDHVHQHTKWLQRSRDWQEKGKSPDLLLRGSEFALAETWLEEAVAENKQPLPTELQAAFITASRDAIQAENQQKKRQTMVLRSLLGLVSVCLVISIAIGVEAVRQRRRAERVQEGQIYALSQYSLSLTNSDREFDGLIEAIRVGQLIKNRDNLQPETKRQFSRALRAAVYRVREQTRLQGHNHEVWDVIFSPDGKIIATASYDNTVKLWNRNGQLLSTLSGHTDGIRKVDFSPDGQTVLTGSFDQTIKLWRLDGTIITSFPAHEAAILSVSFSPDGQIIASASQDRTVKLWNLDGTLISTLRGHTGEVNSVTFSPDGQTIASASDDKTIKLWTRDGKLQQTLRGHEDLVFDVTFSPDGQTIASAGRDKTVILWSRQGQLLKRFAGHDASIYSVRFSPDSQILATSSYDKTIKLWSRQGQALQTLIGHNAQIRRASFSPDGQTLASASHDKTVKLWTLDTQTRQTLTGHQDQVNSIRLSPDGQTIASASYDKTVKLWTRDGRLLHTLVGHSDIVWDVSFSPDGQLVASASEDGTVRLWNLQGQLLQELENPNASNSVSSTNGVAVNAAVNAAVDAAVNAAVKVAVNSVDFSADGQTIVSADMSGNLKLWQLDGKLIKTVKGDQGAIYRVRFSPDGQIIASGNYSNTVTLWSATGEKLHLLTGHTESIYSVQFSADSQLLVSASKDGTIKIWTRDGEERQTLIGHNTITWDATFSPDGQIIASGDDNHLIKLWNQNGEELQTLLGHTAKVNGLQFSADGQTIISASADKSIIIWTLDLDKLATLQTLNINDLMGQACDWVADYLHYNPFVTERDRQICDGITTDG
jgi:WD40 repeat protein